MTDVFVIAGIGIIWCLVAVWYLRRRPEPVIQVLPSGYRHRPVISIVEANSGFREGFIIGTATENSSDVLVESEAAADIITDVAEIVTDIVDACSTDDSVDSSGDQ